MGNIFRDIAGAPQIRKATETKQAKEKKRFI